MSDTPDLAFICERFFIQEGAVHRPADLAAAVLDALRGWAVDDNGQLRKLVYDRPQTLWPNPERSAAHRFHNYPTKGCIHCDPDRGENIEPLYRLGEPDA